MEEYKRRCLQLFLERIKMSLEHYANFVKDREENLRDCYADKIDLRSDEFVKIMMVDSAFVYEMLVLIGFKIDMEDTSNRLFNRPFLLLNVIEDLMLLENQIPLFILEDLFNFDMEAKSAQQSKSSIRSDEQPGDIDAILSSEDQIDPSEKIQMKPDRSSSNLEDASKVEEQGQSDISLDLVSRANMPIALTAMMEPGFAIFRGRRPPKARADSSNNLLSDKVEPIKKMQTERHRSSSNLEDASKVEEQGKSDISSYLNSRANMHMPPPAMAMMKPGGGIPRGPPLEAGADSFMDLVYKFINWRPEIGARGFDSSRICSCEVVVVHLLDCLRICHLSPTDPPPPEAKTMLLSSLIGGCLPPFSKPESNPPLEADETSHLLFSLPTITELHQSGVKFAQNTNSTCLLDIKFDRQQGILKIPHFFMGDSTEPVFRNLLAFEQCHYEEDRLFTDYFTLLDQLIDDPSNVDLLVLSGVLTNTLGNNTRAASVINNITLGLTVSRERYFDDLRMALTKYYKVPWRKWRVTLRQDYFNYPRAVISVIAATILLALTIVHKPNLELN